MNKNQTTKHYVSSKKRNAVRKFGKTFEMNNYWGSQGTKKEIQTKKLHKKRELSQIMDEHYSEHREAGRTQFSL
jgi:hypothetical protein